MNVFLPYKGCLLLNSLLWEYSGIIEMVKKYNGNSLPIRSSVEEKQGFSNGLFKWYRKDQRLQRRRNKNKKNLSFDSHRALR